MSSRMPWRQKTRGDQWALPLVVIVLSGIGLSGVGLAGCDQTSSRAQHKGSSPKQGQPSAPNTSTKHAAPPRDDAQPLPKLFTRSRPLMGTVFMIQVDAPEARAASPVRAAFEEIARLETVLSEWRPTSEISQINHQAGRAPVQVGKDTLAVVQAGLNVSRWSRGAFDLSWAALRGLYDFRPGKHKVPPRASVRKALRNVRYRDIVIDEEANTVFLKRKGMAIGTGGIAKGYALDRAGAILRAAGLLNYMLFAGGQVQVHGRRSHRAWRVGIQHPRNAKDYFAFFEAENRSISTSGDYEHFFVDDEGTRWHHIIDLKTGLPARRSMSVTLMAQSGLYADALSTATFVLGPKKGLDMLRRVPQTAEAIVVGADCTLSSTPGTERHLRMRVNLEGGALPGCK